MKKNKHLFQLITIVGIVFGIFLLPFLFRISEDGFKLPKKEELLKELGTCKISIKVSGQTKAIDLEEYIVGVVAAEMPANFHEEALKAQSIAARTYVLKMTNFGENEIEPTVANQVFYNEEKRKEVWNQSFEEYEQKIKNAVQATQGEVIYYSEELITAMFHSMSNGMTESSQNYSGTDLPYLQPVASTDFQYAQNYTVTTNYSLEEWNKLLRGNWTIDQIKSIRLQKNNTGRVDKVTLAGKEWTGRQFREHLNLRSTDFDVSVNNNTIVVKTEGYGHGVGMSQYGADFMAKQGSTAHEIIKHYYTNTNVDKISCKK